MIRLSCLTAAFGTLMLTSCGEEAQFKADVKVLSTVGQGVGDLSFVDEVIKGVALARLQSDFFIEIFEPQTFEEAENQFGEWLTVEGRLSSVLIIMVGAEYVALVENKNCRFNGRFILHVDQNLGECENLSSATFRTFAPSFLAGVASMKMSDRKSAAVIGGMDIPPVNEFIEGYKAGVQFAGGEVTATEYLSDDFDGFNDPEKAKETATRLYEEADVIIPVAGGSSIGVIEAAKEEEKPRYVIGVDTDQSVHGVNVVIGSVTKNLKKVVSTCIVDLGAGEFNSGAIDLGLEEDGADFLPNTLFADQFKEAVDNAREAAIEAEKSYHEGL